MDDLLLEVLKLRKEVSELRAIITEKERFKQVESNGGIEGRITTFLYEIKIPTKFLGFSYLREAIKQVYDDPDLVGAFTSTLYPNIAKKFNTTYSRVERGIRHAIETAWFKNPNHPFYKQHFNDKPTNSAFITLIADDLLIKDKAKTEVK